MATYKGIGYDSGKYKQASSSADTVEFVGSLDVGQSAVIGQNLSVGQDASIGGDLTVAGSVISRGSENLVVQDPFIDLGIGNTSTSALAGGFTISMNRNNSIASETITAMTAGVVATSAPTLTASANSNFSAGDILVITGTSDGSNDGIFVVASVSTTTITLKGTGGSSIDGALPFAQSQVVTKTGESATAYKVDMKVLCIADGSSSFTDAGGTAYNKGDFIEIYVANATESDFTANGDYQLVGASAGGSLQDAYDTGAGITTTGNAIAFTLSNGGFTTSGAGSVSLASSSASSFAVTGNNLTLQTNTSGDVILNSAGVVQVSSGALDINTSVDADVSTFAVDSSSATTITSSQASTGSVVIEASNSAGDVLIKNATSTILTVDANGIGVSGDLDVSGNTTLGDASSDTITFTASAGSSLIPSADNTYDLGSVSLTWANIYASVINAGQLNLASGSQDSILYVGASGEVVEDNANLRYDGNDFEIGASGSPVFAVAVANGNTNVGGTLDVVALASLDGGIDVDGSFTVADGTGDVSTSGTLNVESTSTFADDITLDKASAQAIQKTAGGSGQDLMIVLSGANDSSILVQSAGTGVDAISLDASAGDIAIETGGSGKHVVITSDYPQLARQFTAGTGGVTELQVARLVDDSGLKVLEADANSSSTATVVGVILNTASAGQTTRVAFNGVVDITCDDSFSTADIGKPVYLSAATVGNITKTAPSGTSDVVYQVGIAITGSTNTWTVALQPQYIMEIV